MRYDNITVDQFFRDDLRSSDIVASCVDYIENSNASGKTAIAKYLNAMSKLYKDVMARYHNDTLAKTVPFSKLKHKVEKKISKQLLDESACPPIYSDDFKKILDYFHNVARKSQLMLCKEIMFTLFILYGFKFERLSSLKKESINLDRQSITFDFDDAIELPLPYTLYLKIKKYMQNIDSKQNLLFVSSTGKQITPAFINHVFVQLKKHIGKYDEQLSSTSLSKYAIIKMIENRVDFVTIKAITGMEDVVINDCARIYLQSQSKSDSNSALTSAFNKIDAFKYLHHPQ